MGAHFRLQRFKNFRQRLVQRVAVAVVELVTALLNSCRIHFAKKNISIYAKGW
jgi:hypothetical protein